jgi:methyl-accepting chemotaxis protein
MFSTFKSRLLGIILVINVCMLILGASSYYFLGSLGSRLDTFTNGIYHRLEITNRLREAADARAIAVRNLALLKDPTLSAKVLQEFDLKQKETKDSLAELQDAIAKAGVPQEVSEKVAKIAEIEAKYSPLAQSIVDKIEAGRLDEAIADIQTVCTPTLFQLNAALHDYMELTDKRTLKYVEDTSRITGWQKTAMLITALAALAISVLLGFFLQKNVLATFGAEPEVLTEYLRELAGGNLASKHQESSFTADSLMSAIGRMQSSMRQVVLQVRAASDSISRDSSEIASGNSDLSTRTEHQASELQRTASAMEQMNRSVQHNAESAKSASSLAKSVSNAALGGSEVMHRVSETMDAISKSSSKIGDIIGVIDSISFQTNILALNAAVEAARAGEQGKGFAVVATEVRLLAQRSAAAAREIKTLVNTSVERVEGGSALVSEAEQSVANIVQEVQRVSTLIQDIDQSVQEESRGISEVSASVSALDQGTQQNAALAEQSAAAAQSLRQEADRLAQAVSYFRV